MQRIQRSDIKDLVEYEKARGTIRDRIIALKQDRRLTVGETLTFLFENRHTVLFQIQEMLRTERIVLEDKIQEEIDAYNALIPEPDQLSATLFIEIMDLSRMSNEQVRQAVNRFQGLDHEAVWLRLGDRFTIPAEFEGGHSKEEKMAAVQYVRFVVPAASRAALADPSVPARVVVDHPNYKAEAPLSVETRNELLADLA